MFTLKPFITSSLATGLLDSKSFQKRRFRPIFFNNEKFETAVSVGVDPHLDSNYYILSFGIEGNPGIKVVPKHLLPTDPSTSRKVLLPRSMY